MFDAQGRGKVQFCFVIPGRAKHEPGIHPTRYAERAVRWIPGSLAMLAPRNDGGE